MASLTLLSRSNIFQSRAQQGPARPVRLWLSPGHVSALRNDSLFDQSAHGLGIGFVEDSRDVFDCELVINEQIADCNPAFHVRTQLGCIGWRKKVAFKDLKAVSSNGLFLCHCLGTSGNVAPRKFLNLFCESLERAGRIANFEAARNRKRLSI
jgi:hypothetical protein